MPIPSFITDRLTNAPINGAHVANVFATLACVLDGEGADDGVVVLDYSADGDPIQPGDLVPQIHFTLKRVPHEQAQPGFPAPETVVE